MLEILIMLGIFVGGTTTRMAMGLSPIAPAPEFKKGELLMWILIPIVVTIVMCLYGWLTI
jgi:hypothetical protein